MIISYELEKQVMKDAGWISVDDELPKKQGKYLVIIFDHQRLGQDKPRYHITVRKFRTDNHRFFTGLHCGWWVKYTHDICYWKPLPELPWPLRNEYELVDPASYPKEKKE